MTYHAWRGLLIVLVYVGCAGLGVHLGLLAAQAVRAQITFDKPPVRLSSKDVIISCLQREGVLVYAVTDKGPPKLGQQVTADMFTVVCVAER